MEHLHQDAEIEAHVARKQFEQFYFAVYIPHAEGKGDALRYNGCQRNSEHAHVEYGNEDQIEGDVYGGRDRQKKQ